jgi:uncharacterized caspase-like protein
MKHSIHNQNLTICWNNALSTALLLLLASVCYPQSIKDRQLTQPETTTKTSERRVALVIGNSAYRHVARLDNPANDAEDMAAVLRQLGFELIDGHAHTDQNVEEMKRLILKFGEKLKQDGGVGLFYYAGHGLQVGGRNYLIPIEAEKLREQTVEFEAVDVGRVLAEMDAAGNGFNILILDACRSNPFARSWRSTEGGLAAINAPEGTLIAYATGPGKVANDGNERNGVYTGELLKQLAVPELNVEAMFKAVRARVRDRTKGQQIPWESSSLIGDFYFSHKNAKERLSPGPSTPQSSANVALEGPAESKSGGRETDPLKGTVWLWRDASIDTLPVFLEFLPNGLVRTSTPKDKNGYIAANIMWYRTEDTVFVLYFNDADRKTLLTECKGQISRGRIEGTTRNVKAETTASWLLTRVSN